MAERAQLRETRLELLEWVVRIGAVTDEALAARRGCGWDKARSQLVTAERAGLLVRERVGRGGPALYTPTRVGLRAVGQTGLVPTRVTAASARHLIVCTKVAVSLEGLYPGQRVQGEQQLRRDEREAARPLASTRVGGGGGGARSHHPDLVIWPAPGKLPGPVAIEVELTLKAPRRLTQICATWAASSCVAGVLYLVTPEVERPVRRAIEAVRGEDRIAVVALDSLLRSARARPTGALLNVNRPKRVLGSSWGSNTAGKGADRCPSPTSTA